MNLAKKYLCPSGREIKGKTTRSNPIPVTKETNCNIQQAKKCTQRCKYINGRNNCQCYEKLSTI